MGRFSLILIVGFAIVAGGLKLNHGRLSRRAQEVSTQRHLDLAARNATNSAVNLCLDQLAQNFDWRTGYQNIATSCGGTASATVADASTDSTLAANEVRITATGNFGGENLTAIVLMRKSAFSEFAYFTNVEPWIYFITGDTLKGPIHTNGQFHIAGDPAFYGLVSSVAGSWLGYGDPQFKAGTNFGCSAITLPTDLSIIEGVAGSGGALFDSDVAIEFLSDGTFDWEVYHLVSGNPVVDSTGNMVIADMNGVIATVNDHDIRVKGTLDGQVTILSDGDIWIDDNVLYAQDPTTNPAADDMLGLISKDNVIVTDNAANANDCIIHASVMALNTSFKVENYSQGTTRGTLIVLGGIVQNKRGAVGTMRYGEIYTGYRKLYSYDQRYMTKAPPFYPVFSKNTIVSWYE